MKNQDIHIFPLSSYPEYAPILAFWSYSSWYRERDIDFNILLKSYKQRARGRKLPLSYIAVSGTCPIGMVSIKENDLWARPDLNPWLASLFVIPRYRKIGAGGKLVTAAIECAKKHAFETLYLFTGGDGEMDLDRYYERRGWIFFEKNMDNDGKETNIYTYSLQGKS